MKRWLVIVLILTSCGGVTARHHHTPTPTPTPRHSPTPTPTPKPTATPTPKPTSTPTATPAHSITFGWGAVPTAEGYKLYRGIASGAYTEHITVGNVTKATWPIPDNTKRFYAITAFNVKGESGFSNEVSFP
jgi:hypothetical protein